jgi:hypothetical protein
MSAVKTPNKLRLRDLKQVRLLAHPLRLRLLEQFATGAKTTKQAAETLGEPLTKLYHHVHALERAGLLVLRGTQRVRGAVEKYYEAAARLFEVDDSLFRGDVGPALTAAVVEAGKQGIAPGMSRGRGGARLFAARLLVPGGARHARRLYAELLAVTRRARTAGGAERARAAPWVLTITLLPPAPPSGSRKRKA